MVGSLDMKHVSVEIEFKIELERLLEGSRGGKSCFFRMKVMRANLKAVGKDPDENDRLKR